MVHEMPAAARSPQQPQLPAQLAGGEIGALTHDAAYTELELRDVDLRDQRARGESFDGVRSRAPIRPARASST